MLTRTQTKRLRVSNRCPICSQNVQGSIGNLAAHVDARHAQPKPSQRVVAWPQPPHKHEAVYPGKLYKP